jgi:hypothetical protein
MAKIGSQSPKTEFGAQNRYGRVTIVREFYMEQEKICFWGSKQHVSVVFINFKNLILFRFLGSHDLWLHFRPRILF